MLFQTTPSGRGNINLAVGENHPEHFPLHSHRQIEIVFCLEGSMRASCNAVEKELFPGDVMIAFSNDIHAYMEKCACKSIMIIFNPDISERLLSVLQKTQYRNFVSCPEVIPVAQSLLSCDPDFNSLVTYGLLHQIMGMILEEKHHKDKQTDLSAFDSAILYVSQHYTEPLTLQKLAVKAGVSQAHLSRIFSERIEGGFMHYLHILRTEKAKTLLKETTMQISEIMYASGFSDQRTFNRVFKKQTGQTPREYRKMS